MVVDTGSIQDRLAIGASHLASIVVDNDLPEPMREEFKKFWRSVKDVNADELDIGGKDINGSAGSVKASCRALSDEQAVQSAQRLVDLEEWISELMP